MRTLALTVLALAALAAGALAAERALRAQPPVAPRLSIDAGEPLFALRGLRNGDRAERCVTVTNEGPGEVRGEVLGRVEEGDLAGLLGVAVLRGCDGGTLLFSGRLDELEAAGDPEPWPEGERRRYRIAVEVRGSDEEVQGRRAVHEFAFAAEGEGGAPREAAAPGEPPTPGERNAPGEGEAAAPSAPPPTTAASAAPPCTTIGFAPAGSGRRRRAVLIKFHRVDRRVRAKLILRIYGAPGRQRLVLVTGLRIGRHRVLMGRRWGRVLYRVGSGPPVASTVRPFRVRIAPGALKPGRNVVRVTTVPRRGRVVRARYVLRIKAPSKGTSACVIG